MVLSPCFYFDFLSTMQEIGWSEPSLPIMMLWYWC